MGAPQWGHLRGGVPWVSSLWPLEHCQMVSILVLMVGWWYASTGPGGWWVVLGELPCGVVVGFTGSRGGVCAPQREALMGVLSVVEPREGHYGDCVGWDCEFFGLCRGLGVWTVGHPPVKGEFRAWTVPDELRPVKDYLVRDWDIVVESDLLVACPKESCVPLNKDGSLRKRGSGTWTTVSYGWALGRVVVLVFPDGGVKVTRGLW